MLSEAQQRKLREELKDCERKLSQGRVSLDKEAYVNLSKRYAYLKSIVYLLDKLNKLQQHYQDTKLLLESKEEEAEVKELARQELESLEERISELEEEIEEKIFESESEPNRGVILEIRPAAGGLEASLFAADLFRMYSKYILRKNWKREILSSHPTDLGGFKEIIFGVRGDSAYAYLKFEKGVHRVQRVPTTESSGRLHTSTVTVAVLKEPEEIEVAIDNKDLKIETFRSSGHGGQHLNVTDSAVRITHLPSGIVVTCQDERSQIKNRAKAMRILKAKILDLEANKQAANIAQERKNQVGSGERSEKIRTYNFPQNRLTDHRIPLTIYRLDAVMEGDLDLIIKPLIRHVRMNKIGQDV